MKANQRIAIVSTIFATICLTINCQDRNNFIKPGQVWPDNGGKHINAHGGGILFYNYTYYWFGE
jgi:hypothetical protein